MEPGHWFKVGDGGSDGVVHLGLLIQMTFLNAERAKHPARCLEGVGSSVNVSSFPCARNEELRWRNQGEGSAEMEVPAQLSGDEVQQVAGKVGVELVREEK